VSTRRAGVITVALVATAAFLVGGCGGSSPDAGRRNPRTSARPDSTTGSGGALVLQAREEAIPIYDGPEAATPTDRFPDGALAASAVTSAPGIPIVLLATEAAPSHGRREVYLPVRPNGSTGWVDEGNVNAATVPYRVRVALSEHRITVTRNDAVVLTAPIAVGTSETPSPSGVYYLKELLAPPDPTGPYGHYAYGLSGFSNALANFAGGDGVIGIHGTNDPASIGRDVSHGCIRVTNEVIDRMAEQIRLPLGTPVEIVA
jgi:lipoprotein-anchoring transpeptidase ErfK/SrfK